MKRFWNLATLWSRPKPVVAATPADVVHEENKLRLLRYRPAPGGPRIKTPLLLVPSLINRHYVLDLMPGKSFVEWLVAQGHDVFVIDWGTPGDEDRYLTLDDIAGTYLGRALRKTASFGKSGKAHVLGYCLGGTLAALHAARYPERFASLVAIAAPVRFADGGMLTAWTRSPTFDVDALVRAFGNAPAPLLQASFHMLRPTLTLSKAVHLLDRAWDDQYLDGTLALETWGNDNVSFPGACYAQYVRELYRDDALVRGTFCLDGRPAPLSAITCPLMAVTFEHDNIVPKACATPLLELVSSKRKEHVHLPGGHVGAVVSRAAAKSLWPQISAFVR